MSHKYLVASALQEELTEFTNLLRCKEVPLSNDVSKWEFRDGEKTIEVLTVTSNKMGMPYNAAKLMEVIKEFNPIYTLFVGICAIFKSSKYPLGTVLIPQRIYSYESGKYKEVESEENEGEKKVVFEPDYNPFDTSDHLRKNAEQLRLGLKTKYHVTTDDDFCSGSAVIDASEKVDALDVKHLKGGRKVKGLDMEAYSLACINQILRPTNDVLVIKGASDYAANKGLSEGSTGERQAAKENAAHFAFELIKYLDNKYPSMYTRKVLEISAEGKEDEDEDATYKMKIHFRIKNPNSFPVTLQSISFTSTNSNIPVHSKAGLFTKPQIKIGRNKINGVDKKGCDIYKDIYKEVYTLEPNGSILSCWLAIDSGVHVEALRTAVDARSVGYWHYRCYSLKGNDVEIQEYKEKV